MVMRVQQNQEKAIGYTNSHSQNEVATAANVTSRALNEHAQCLDNGISASSSIGQVRVFRRAPPADAPGSPTAGPFPPEGRPSFFHPRSHAKAEGMPCGRSPRHSH